MHSHARGRRQRQVWLCRETASLFVPTFRVAKVWKLFCILIAHYLHWLPIIGTHIQIALC